MAENNPKKKRFVYKSVLGSSSTKAKKHEPAPPLVDFPDDFDTLTQPTKKMKLDLEKPPPPQLKKKAEKTDNYFDDIDFEDDIDAFDLKEIDQIEIAASQQLGIKPKTTLMKPMPKVDALDQLLEDTQNIRPSSSNGRSTSLMPGPSNSNRYRNNDKTMYLLPSQRNDPYKNKPSANPTTTTINVQNNRTMNHNNSIYGQKNNKNEAAEQQQMNIQQVAAEKKKNLEESFQKQYHQAQKTVTEYKTKLDTMNKKFNSKDGEIKILREKLRKSSEDELRMKERLITLEGSSKTEQSKKESDLIKELEKLKTQLKFKENEVKEAIAKQKQLERQPRIKPTPKSPIKDKNIPDGFLQSSKGKTLKPTQEAATQNKKTVKLIDRNPMMKLNNCLRRSTVSTNSATQIMKKLSMITLEKPFSVEQPDFKCQHLKNASFPKEKHSIFMSDIQSSLEMFEQNDLFVVEYIRRIIHHLKSLEELFIVDQQTDKDRPSQRISSSDGDSAKKRKDSSGTPCNICNHLYQVGILCLFTLKESCLTYHSVCTYLLSCFETRRSKSRKNVKNDTEQTKQEVVVDDEKYFKKLENTNFLIKKMKEVNIQSKIITTPNTAAGQLFWEKLLNLTNSKVGIVEVIINYLQVKVQVKDF